MDSTSCYCMPGTHCWQPLLAACPLLTRPPQQPSVNPLALPCRYELNMQLASDTAFYYGWEQYSGNYAAYVKVTCHASTTVFIDSCARKDPASSGDCSKIARSRTAGRAHCVRMRW